MPKVILLFLFLLMSSSSACAFTDEAAVKIISPLDGSRVGARTQTRIVYEVIPGPRGDHSHIYVDKTEAGVLRKLQGEYTLETMTIGNHNICIKVVNKAHTQIGIEKCIKVKVE